MSQTQTRQADPTRERLLNEAERLFAGKGYDAVSLREITTAAGTHLAAVNYHFGSKENLYLEVFASAGPSGPAKSRHPCGNWPSAIASLPRSWCAPWPRPFWPVR